jgi:hypothetical protein
MAFARLSACHYIVRDFENAERSARKAYELRQRVSDRERFYIESKYEDYVNQNAVASRQVYESWGKAYP